MAEANGYSVKSHVQKIAEDYRGEPIMGTFYDLMRDGCFMSQYHASEDSAWLRAPHFSTDLSACAPLLDEMAAQSVEIELYDLQASVTVRGIGGSVFVLGPPSVALPRAIAIAYVLYRQEREVSA